MGYLNTLLGPLHPEEMGIVAAREHILWGPESWGLAECTWLKIAKVFERAFSDLLDFKLQGGGTFVDCSGIGWGRDIDVAVKLAAVTGVHIVASTGFWSGAGTPAHFRGMTTDELAALFTHELTVGMGHTRVKAGVLSVGSADAEPTDLERRIYHAAARAARKTGACVVTHGISAWRLQCDIFRQESLELSRVVFGDCDQVIDIERDKELARMGAWVGYDNVGLEAWSSSPHARPDDERVQLVARMVESGHASNLIVSAGSKAGVLGDAERHISNVGNVLRYFAPKLKHAGITDAQLHGLLTLNPAQALQIQ